MNRDETDHGGLRIGELARRTGVSVRSLRYYEQRGLLSARRDRNGYRRYDSDVVALVRNVRRLLDAGLSVADIQRFGPCLESPELGLSPCTAALEVFDQRLSVLDARIATLAELRSNLAVEAAHLRARPE